MFFFKYIKFFFFFNILINNYNLLNLNSSFFFLNSLNFNIFNISFSIDLFGYILLLLAFGVGLLSLLSLDSRLILANLKFYSYFNFFVLIVYIFISTNNIWIFFLFYELLLLPSFLFVYFTSYTRKAIQASLYFVIWTQVGSLLVLISICYLYIISGETNFNYLRLFPFTANEQYFIYVLLFFGFGFKIPLWPFHYWLTKTHVEAPTGFSIYLSGFLVKSALYGFFKLNTLLNIEINTTIFGVFAFMGAIDASLKMWGQTDLKKLVAYCTVQEMNLILIMFLWGDNSSLICGMVFSAAHAFLSGLMFYLVDCIYRRYDSRNIVEVNGLIHQQPNLGILIMLMCIFYAGLPGTIKFSCEFFIFSSLIEFTWFPCVLLILILNVIGIIGFSKCWFNTIFGAPILDSVGLIKADLVQKEFGILMIFFFTLVSLTYFNFFIF